MLAIEQNPACLYAQLTPPTFRLTSANIIWKGAFFADVQGVSGYNRTEHLHTKICLQFYSAPTKRRKLAPKSSWFIQKPGLQICLPGDEQRHETQSQGGVNKFLFLEPSRIEEIIGQPLKASMVSGFRTITAHSIMASHLMQAMAQDLAGGSSCGALIGDSLIVSLVAWLAQSSPIESDNKQKTARITQAKLSQLISYIDERLAQDLSIDKLACQLGVTPRHFYRALSTTTGDSPYGLVTKRRVQRAKNMILENGNSLAGIAAATGFADQSHMTRTFKKYLGVTPADYRRDVAPTKMSA